MKHLVFKILSILASIYGHISKLCDNGYLKFIVANVRGGRIAVLAKKAGKRVTLGKSVHLAGMQYTTVGDMTGIGEYSIVTAYKALAKDPELTIGSNCNIGPYNHITCINKVQIGNGLLTGRWVTITDNSHGNNTLEELSVAPWQRKLSSKAGVVIGQNVWIGDKATILPGVTIGDGSIIGANSVVTKDVPPHTIVCGNPARIVKQIIKQ